MKKVITIQIIRPDLDGLNREELTQLLNEMANDIAQQILTQEQIRSRNNNILYWQRRFQDWEIEDRLNEIKYGNPDDSSIK